MYSGPRDSAPSFPSTTPRRSLSPATSSITESSNKPQTEDAERNFSFMESIKACSSPTGNTLVYVGENVCYIGGIGTDKKFHRKVTRSISRRDGHFDCDKINVHDDMIALYIHLESRPRDIWVRYSILILFKSLTYHRSSCGCSAMIPGHSKFLSRSQINHYSERYLYHNLHSAL